MGAQTSRINVQTLGASLSGLKAGDPCPCCEAALQGRAAGRFIQPVRSVGDTTGRKAALLSCPACGCEVEAADSPGQSGDCRWVYAAA